MGQGNLETTTEITLLVQEPLEHVLVTKFNKNQANYNLVSTKIKANHTRGLPQAASPVIGEENTLGLVQELVEKLKKHQQFQNPSKNNQIQEKINKNTKNKSFS
jgi:hypothetical protein